MPSISTTLSQQPAVRHRLGRSADGWLRLLVQPAADFQLAGGDGLAGDPAYRRHHPQRPAAALPATRRQPFSAGDAQQLALCLALVAAGQRSGPPGRLAAAARGSSPSSAAAAAGDLAPLCRQRSRGRSLFHSPLLAEADFLACQADANEQLDLAQADSSSLASSEHYPAHKLRQIHSALRQRQLNLPLWLLSWNTLTGDTRDTNGRFFAARC
jgi:hypothetical protein